ncbi:MAG: 1-deoxy-D-xylulose-5-phosphate reductoisomerase [Alphaproteobacteria bacterium]|nr:1-deoxy-D-xylulose-5-phosphate reductoisomerase [Alphaproteobacteria bacterium]
MSTSSFQKVAIFGSTGSVGLNTIKVLQAQKEQYDVRVLTANSNVGLLAAQAKELDAAYAVIADETKYEELKQALAGTDVTPMAGQEALLEAASMEADWTMAAIVGMAGLAPLMKSIEQGKIVAIANKEPLVAAGPLVMEAARQSGAMLLPVDSEHNAVFQVFEPENKKAVERIILTASGGPFRDATFEEMEKATPEQALAHPNWEMGAKISVDSATMMNKALEVIEAQRLFDLRPSQIEVLVHPQSLVHAMVEYSDGSILAQMGAADMCTPITNALGWPERLKTPGERLDLAKMSHLEFRPVDLERFPSVTLAYECLEEGLHACIALNAANEVAVEAFLSHKIAFLDIYHTVSEILRSAVPERLESLDDIISYDKLIRARAKSAMVENNFQQTGT